ALACAAGGADAPSAGDDTPHGVSSPARSAAAAWAAAAHHVGSGGARFHRSRAAEQADAHIGASIDDLAVRFEHAVGDAHDQLAVDDALQVDLVDHLLDVRGHLAGELDLADAQRPTLAGAADPAQVEADQLPHGVQAQAAGHDRIADEVALEEPEVRIDVEFGLDIALAVV